MLNLSSRTYYPVFLNLKGYPCLVVGGGEVATAKIHWLITSAANVKIVAPHITNQIFLWHQREKVEWVPRTFQKEDLHSIFLVIAATNDRKLNRKIAFLAQQNQLLFNSVDDPKHSNFISPAIAQRGAVQVAVSTSGKSPALGKEIRDRILQEVLTPEIGELAKTLGRWRPRVQSQLPTYESRKNFWEKVLRKTLYPNTPQKVPQ